MSQASEAVALFQQGCSCSQAVLGVFAEELGLPRELAFKVAAGFGGGLGRLGGTCGVVSGAVMVLGLRHGGTVAGDRAAKEETYERVREFVRRFQARHGSSVCRELLGCDLSTPAGLQRAKEQKLTATLCPYFVASAVEILQGLEGRPLT